METGDIKQLAVNTSETKCEYWEYGFCFGFKDSDSCGRDCRTFLTCEKYNLISDIKSGAISN